MFINPLTAAMGAIGLLSELTSHHAKKDKEEKDTLTQLTTPDNYNVNNMSFDELKAMTLALMQNNKLSEDEGQQFLAQMTSVQQTSGVASTTKIDMVQLYQQQLQNLKADDNKNSSSLQRSLELLNGLKARSGVIIPQAV